MSIRENVTLQTIPGKFGQRSYNRLMSDQPLPPIHTLWNYNAPAESAARFHTLLLEAEAAGATEYYLELHTQLARTHSLQGQFDEAHAILDEVEPQITAVFPKARMRYLLERGRCFNSAGAAETAVPFFKQAYETGLATGASDDLTIDAAHMLGIALPTAAEQLEWNLLALDFAEKTTDEKASGWRGSLYNNIGWTYHDRGEYDKALAMFEQALAYYETEKPDQIRNIRIGRWSVGHVLRSLGRVDEALAIQQALAEEHEAAGDAPDGFVHEELAECYLLRGEEEKARSHFARAYELLSQVGWFVRSNPERLERMAQFGDV